LLMADERWVSDEPRLSSVARQVIARALHRPVLVLGVAMLVAGPFVARRVLRPPAYEAALHFRIAEGELSDPLHAPRAPRGIHDYIRNVAMSRDRVERILKDHPSFGSNLEGNREKAVELFREDVDIQVSRNYFILDWSPGNTPRSARVAISLRALDGAEALEILHEIGAAILQDQAEYRLAHVASSRDLVDAQLREATARARDIQQRLGRLQWGAAGGNPAHDRRDRSQIATLQGESRAATAHLVELERLAAAVRLTAAAEQDDLGLAFELYDESVVPYGVRLTPLKLAALGTFAFGVTLLITLLVVGSFDDRVYAPTDLLMRGLPVFGALARFPGDDAWTYRWRTSPRGR